MNTKNLYIVSGTMGVGKSTVCQIMKEKLNNSVFLDGDWCWDAHPFQVTEETKHMVLQNISFLLNQFIHCSAYQNIIFCWVMHEKNIMDTILENIDKSHCRIVKVSLICDEKELTQRLMKDVNEGKRKKDVVSRSIKRIACYEKLDTVKINTNNKSAYQTADEIILL